MKYLILGSKGLIGSSLSKYIKKQNHEVLDFDILNTEEEDLRKYKNKKLAEYMDISDFVFFLAFDIGGSKYLKEYQKQFKFIQNNIKIMTNTFEQLEKRKKKFIFASSQMANMSMSNYGLLKLIGEKITESLDGLNIKFWNVYGKEYDDIKAHVITDFIDMAKKGCIKMMTTGREKRQFLHVEDTAECLYNLSDLYNTLDKKKNYHVTSFSWSSIAEIAEIVKKYIPCKIIPGENLDCIQNNIKNEPDDHILKYWNPKIQLEKGIKGMM